VTKVPSLNYEQVVRALERDGWLGIRQRGSHIRLHKYVGGELLRLTVPAHKPIKRSTLSHILKQARIDVERFLTLV
jgi:predicted RNA binding protein YcfA (HicA-like mRNA interferase family)